MSIRSDDRERIAQLLNTIVHQSANLTVIPHYVNEAGYYPYIYITDGGYTCNWESNQTYKEMYEYIITCVFTLADDDMTQLQADIADLEQAINTVLKSRNTRDAQNDLWIDLYLREVSAPFQDDVAVNDNTVLKTFKLEIQKMTPYV